MIMDQYAAWDKAGRNHAWGAFATPTLRQIEQHIARINIPIQLKQVVQLIREVDGRDRHLPA
jgi:hypothetical protein